MSDWLSSGGGVGMGLLFFGITVAGFLRRKAGNVVARSLYPGLADKLGLDHKPSPYKGGVGRIEGTYEGFRVTVDPDDQRRIHLRFNGQPAVALHSYTHNKRPANGQLTFRPSSRVLSAQFKTTHGSEELIARINGSDELAEVVKPLKYVRQLKTISITDSGIVFVFDYGSPPYIPADVVGDSLARMARIARLIEPSEP